MNVAQLNFKGLHSSKSLATEFINESFRIEFLTLRSKMTLKNDWQLLITLDDGHVELDFPGLRVVVIVDIAEVFHGDHSLVHKLLNYPA